MSIATTGSDVLTVNPTTHEVDLQGLRTGLHRRLTLAGDEGFDTPCRDRAGAPAPPTSPWCRVPAVVDAGLATQPASGFAAADRVTLLDVTQTRLGRLLHPAEHLLRASGLRLT